MPRGSAKGRAASHGACCCCAAAAPFQLPASSGSQKTTWVGRPVSCQEETKNWMWRPIAQVGTLSLLSLLFIFLKRVDAC